MQFNTTVIGALVKRDEVAWTISWLSITLFLAEEKGLIERVSCGEFNKSKEFNNKKKVLLDLCFFF